MAREGQFDLLRRAAFHGNDLANDAKRLPTILVLVLRGIGRVQLIDVEVLLVDIEDGEAKGDGSVVPKRDSGQRRFARADHVEARCGEVHQVAKARRRIRPVRVVCKNRATGRRFRRSNHPAIAALGKRLLIESRDRLRTCRDLEHILAHRYVLRRELKHLQDVRRKAWIEPVRHLRLPVVGESEADLISVHVVRLAQGVGARHLGEKVSREPVGADTHYILRRPLSRSVVELFEFPRQARGVLREPIHIRVDAVDEPLRDRFGFAGCASAIDTPLAVHVAAIEEQPSGAILLEEPRTEHLRELPKTAASPQVDLKQSVSRSVEPLHIEEVCLAPGVYMRHAPTVHANLGRSMKARDAQSLLRNRNVLCQSEWRCEQRCRDDQDARANAMAGFHVGASNSILPDVLNPALKCYARSTADVKFRRITMKVAQYG